MCIRDRCVCCYLTLHSLPNTTILNTCIVFSYFIIGQNDDYTAVPFTQTFRFLQMPCPPKIKKPLVINDMVVSLLPCSATVGIRLRISVYPTNGLLRAHQYSLYNYTEQVVRCFTYVTNIQKFQFASQPRPGTTIFPIRRLRLSQNQFLYVHTFKKAYKSVATSKGDSGSSSLQNKANSHKTYFAMGSNFLKCLHKK